MIIKLKDLTNYSSHLKKFILLYGSNAGQIEDIINNFFKPNLSRNIFYYDENEIITNINEFKDGVINKSFFDNNKLIIINRATDKILDVIQELIIKEISEITIIIKADTLEKKSKLRTFFEKNDETICVPFYDDNYQSLFSISRDFFSKNKINISTQNINYIVENSINSRLKLKNELEKILSFCKQKSIIEFKDIIRITNTGENLNIYGLVDQLLIRNKRKAIQMLNDNIFSTEDNILIIKTLLSKLKKLKKLQKEIEIKKNQDIAISTFKPKIFWKEKDVIKKQLKILSLKDIKNLINDLSNLELLIKKNFSLSNILTNNYFIEKFILPNS